MAFGTSNLRHRSRVLSMSVQKYRKSKERQEENKRKRIEQTGRLFVCLFVFNLFPGADRLWKAGLSLLGFPNT